MSEPLIRMNINARTGYTADQVVRGSGAVTLADLLVEIEQAIDEWGDDCMVVTYDETNRFGAPYGKVLLHDLFDKMDDEEDEL